MVHSAEELAALLGIPVSTLKWRLFEGRKLLKAHLQPLAETLLASVEKQPRKEKPMTTEDVVLLHLDSLRHLPFTRQYLAILRDPAGPSVLPVALNEAEFNALEMALRVQQDASTSPIPQDLSQRLLESFGAHLQQVVINTLTGQILYATATFKQGTRIRLVDMRLAEALVLAVREDTPISITRSLFEARASLDLTDLAHPPSEKALHAGGKVPRKLRREKDLQWEEALRRQYNTARHRRMTKAWERLWTMLLISLAGSPDAVSVEELCTLDLPTTFPTRKVMWDAQSMLAVQLPEQEETSWLLMPPALWETMTHQWHILCDPENQDKPPPLATKAVPDALTPRTQPQAEEMLARVVELPGVRTALLLTPASIIAAWQGPETREHLQRFCDTRNDLSRPFLTQERELKPPGQKMFATFLPKKGTSEQGLLEMSEGANANQVLAEMEHMPASSEPLTAMLSTFRKVTASYWPGLFHCYDQTDLPRTNTELEHYFGSARYHERRASGRKQASPGVVVRGSVRVIASVASCLHPSAKERLQSAEIDREAALEVSRRLGHNRVDVIYTYYIR